MKETKTAVQSGNLRAKESRAITNGPGVAGCLKVSALSLALMAVFTPAYSTPADNPIAVDGVTATRTSSGESISTAQGEGTPSAPGYAVKASGGAFVTLTGDQVSETYPGAKTYGVYAYGTGTTVKATDTNISVSGQDTPTGTGGNAPIGTDAERGGTVNLTGGSVQMKATGIGRTIGVRSMSGGTTVTNGTSISTQAEKSHAVQAFADDFANSGKSVIELTGGSVTTQGGTSYGLYAQNAGTSVTANDVSVTTQGQYSLGAEALNGGAIAMNGGSVVTNGAQASGVDISGASMLKLGGVTVTANGVGSAAASISGGGTLNVSNSGLTSTQSDGVAIVDNGTVTLTGTKVSAGGASIASTLDKAGQNQAITIGAGSTLTQNNGTLLQVNRSDAGMDGNVELELQSGSMSSGNIVDIDGLAEGTRTSGTTDFKLDPGASWSGSAQGLSNVMSNDSTAMTFDAPVAVSGSVTTGANSTVAFKDTAAVGGDVQGGSGAQISFAKGATIGHDLTTLGSAVTFNGTAKIGNDVAADNSAIAFSKANATTIGGNLTLDNGASTHGGTMGTGNQITVSGNAVVDNGSTLGGNMIVAGNVSGSHGILGPGNSVGTLTIGSLSGFTGSYNAEVNAAGQADRIIASGNVTLSGIALHVGQENGTAGYRINTPYTIVQTLDGGTVQGQFASAGMDASMAGTLVMLAPVQYDPTDVKVKFVPDAQKLAAARTGLTPNQNATLSALASVTGANAAVDAVFTGSTGRANALNQLLGDGYASTQTALIDDSHYVRDAANDRVRSSFEGAGTVGAPVTTYGASVWTKGFGSWGQTSGDGNAGRLSDSTGGFLIGADGLVAKKWRVGVMGGYSHSDFDVDSRSFSSQSDNYHLGVYGGTQMGNLGFRAGAAYTWSNIDASRSIAFPGFAGHTNSGYDAGTAQAFGELGYQLHLGRVGVEPFANIAYVNLHTEGFSETGGDAALSAGASNVNAGFSTLGLRASSDFSIGSADLTARGTLGWQHTYGQVTPTSSVAFSGGQAFSVAGVPIARDAAVVEVGLNASITKNASLGVSYSGQLGNHSQDNGFTANFNYRF